MTARQASAALERAVRDLLDLRSMPGADAECVATQAARCRFFARMAAQESARPERQTWTPGLANATPTTGRAQP